MDHKGSSHGTRVKISGERAGRLYKLLKLLSSNSLARTQLLRKLNVGMRTFYRDVDLLRECGVSIETEEGGYSLHGSFEQALAHLPYPDPELTFGDVVTLMKGRSSSHQRLRKQFTQLTK
jgi:biotin operon repressor